MVYVFTEEAQLQELAAQINGLLEKHLKVKADYRRSEIASRKMLSNISHDITTSQRSILDSSGSRSPDSSLASVKN